MTELLNWADKDLLVGDRMSDLATFYTQELKEEEKVGEDYCSEIYFLIVLDWQAEEMVKLMRERGLMTSTSTGLSTLVRMHMEQGDLEKAVATFERLTKEERKVPFKFQLMSRLIELEDMERMQRVLDASISVIGEERSLYDLAHNFLALNKPAQVRRIP